MQTKRTTLFLEDSVVEIENNIVNGTIVLSVSLLKKDEEASTSFNTVFKQCEKVDLFLERSEVKEIAKALSEVLEVEEKL